MSLFADMTPLHIAIAGIWGILILASIVVFALKRLQPDRDHSELSAAR